MKQDDLKCVQAFSACIDKYDVWIQSEERTIFSTTLECTQILSELYFLALNLPGPNAKNLTDVKTESLRTENLEAVRSAASRLPMKHYLKIFDPSDSQDTEPVMGDLVDDLSDIYAGVVPANILYKNGDVDEALWHWNFGFRSHWSWHATGAISALNSYLVHRVEEYVELR